MVILVHDNLGYYICNNIVKGIVWLWSPAADLPWRE